MNETETTLDERLDEARARLRTAYANLAAAEAEKNVAEQHLYDTWQTAAGSDRWKVAQYGLDQREIRAGGR